MPHPPSSRLYFGPYRTPRYRLGKKVLDEARGEVLIVGTSDGRIAWPIGRRDKSRAMILYGPLVRAAKRETAAAVRYWWGASAWLVKKWRRSLGVGHANEGSLLRRREHGRSKAGQKAVRAMLKKAHSPESHAKISATKLGKPRPPKVARLLRMLRVGKSHSAATRQKMSQTHKELNRAPPNGRRWETWEDDAVTKLPPNQAAEKIGRSLSAVMNRRYILGVPDGRTKRQRKRFGRSA